MYLTSEINSERSAALETKRELEILIVDDDKLVRFMHRNFLEKNSIKNKVESFENGKEAWEYVAEMGAVGTSFLVLLDLDMPVMNGWGFLDRLQKYGQDLNVAVVVISSSLGEKEIRKTISYSHVVEYESKPLEMDRFRSIIMNQRVQGLKKEK